MILTTYPTAQDFLLHTRTYLEEHESANNLMLGIAMRLCRHPEWNEFPFYLATIQREDGAILLAATMTPPYELVLSGAGDVEQEAIQAIVDSLIANRWSPPGVNGPKELSWRFAHAWATANHLPCRVKTEERIYELRRVIPARPCPGSLRAAGTEDLPTVAGWQDDFLREAVGKTDPALAQRLADRRISAGDVFLWDDHGPVSMAVKARPTPRGCTVTSVYTPPAQRGRGYASACVAALSQRLLDAGFEFCNLFTDLANPTSNAIYQKIGYVPVCDFTVYHFNTVE